MLHIETTDSIFQAFEKINKNFVETAQGLTGAFDHIVSSLADLKAIENPVDNETAVVLVGNNPSTIYFYRLDVDRAGLENSPFVLSPNENAGNKRWVLSSWLPRFYIGTAAPTTSNDASQGFMPGNMWKYGSGLWVCIDNTVSAASWLPVLAIGATSGTACEGNDSRLLTNDQRNACAVTGASASNKFVVSNDARLSDDRDPTSHGDTHGSTDPIVFGANTYLHISKPTSPAAGKSYLYFGVDGNVYALGANGVERELQGTTLLHASSHALAGADPIATLPTTGEKLALAGTNGSPGTLNRFVTETDPAMTNARTPSSHGNEAHSSTFVATNDSRLSDARTPTSHGNEAHSSTFVADNDSRLTDARTPVSHGNDKHSSTFVETTDSRLSDARVPTSHGNDKHSSTFVETGDSRLSDARVPTSHGNDKHTSTFVATDDSRLSDARTPTSHGNEAHSSTFVVTTDARLSDARTPTSHSHLAADLPATMPPSSHTHGSGDLTDATATPTASKIPIADAGGFVDAWVQFEQDFVRNLPVDGILSITNGGLLTHTGAQLPLYDSTASKWRVVKPSSAPTITNTANPLGTPTQAVAGKNYDIFAEYSSATAFNLVIAEWYSDTARCNTYNSGTTYAVDDRCVYSGVYYTCIQAGSNHQPDSSPTYWASNGADVEQPGLYNFNGRYVFSSDSTGKKRLYLGVMRPYVDATAAAAYAAGTTYQVGRRVTDGGHYYISLVNGNVGHTPASSPTYWQDMGVSDNGAGVIHIGATTKADFQNYVGVANYYNRKQVPVGCIVDALWYEYTASSWAEASPSNTVRAHFVTAFPGMVWSYFNIRTKLSAGWHNIVAQINTTSSAGGSHGVSVSVMQDLTVSSTIKTLNCRLGYNYGTIIQYGDGTNICQSAWPTAWLYVEV